MYILVIMLSSELKEFSTLAPNWFQSCDCCTWQLSTLDDLLQFTFIFFFTFTFTFANFCLTNLIFTFTLTCQQLSIHDGFLQFPFFFAYSLHSFSNPLTLSSSFCGIVLVYLLVDLSAPLAFDDFFLFSFPFFFACYAHFLKYTFFSVVFPPLLMSLSDIPPYKFLYLPCPLLNSLLESVIYSLFDHQWKEQNYRRG